MTPTQCRFSIAIVMLSSLFTMSCSKQGMTTGGKKTCTREGTTVQVGQTTPSGDGCNTCVCQSDGNFACTNTACPSDAAPDSWSDLSSGQLCVDGGKTYAIGEVFQRDCNTCTCTSFGIACTLMACLPVGGAGGAVTGTGGAIAGAGGAGGNLGSGGSSAGAGGAGGNLGSGGSSAGTGGVGGNRGSGGSSAGTGGGTSASDAAPQGCTQGGHTYAIGESFSLDCNTCVCTVNGIACTAMACIYDARPDQPLGFDLVGGCSLSANLTFGHDGGNVVYWDVNHLTSSAFTITRNYTARSGHDGATTATCSPSLPACGTAGAVTIATINADLADPDVQGLWSLPQDPVPLFGSDSRPVDGTVYSIALDDGRKVLVGDQCASPTMSSCRYIPAGLVRLTQDLQDLATAMLADPACKNL